MVVVAVQRSCRNYKSHSNAGKKLKHGAPAPPLLFRFLVTLSGSFCVPPRSEKDQKSSQVKFILPPSTKKKGRRALRTLFSAKSLQLSGLFSCKQIQKGIHMSS